MSTVPVGMVHGRFQPFHNEHLEYVMDALTRCDELVVGITNPDPGEYEYILESDHRHRADANPYSFYARLLMVRECLADENVELSRVAIVPFHLMHSDRWPHYLPRPREVVQFIRVFSPWEERKASMFESHGFTVVDIAQGAEKGMTATEVRELMAAGGNWRPLVPVGTARVIDSIGAGAT